MERLLVKWADIPFVITVHNQALTPWLKEYCAAVPAGDALGIRIEVVPDSGAADDYDLDQVPEISFTDNLFTINHPDYRGQYHIDREEGTVWASGQSALIGVLRNLLTVVLVERNGLAVHSSCILKDDQAYIFSGPSGSGKSTVIEYTYEPLLYSDELTLIRKGDDGKFRVYHSPFRSEYFTPPQGVTGKIAGVYFLKQDSQVRLAALSETQAILPLLNNVFFPIEGRSPFEQKIFELCCDFLGQVPAWDLHFRKDTTFWRYILNECENVSSKS